MYKKLFKSNLSSFPYSRSLFNLSKKTIYHNPKVGYYAPIEEDHLGEVKTWLKETNPQLLCVYFSNDWNPISVKAEEGYKNFVKQNSKVTHLKINSDKFPKLRWFFDARLEPSIKLFYHGSLLKTMGGCNFQKFETEITRLYHYVNGEYSPAANYNKEYEMPYYNWEAHLSTLGNEEEYEQSGGYIYIGFRGIHNFRAPPGEKYLTHERMRK